MMNNRVGRPARHASGSAAAVVMLSLVTMIAGCAASGSPAPATQSNVLAAAPAALPAEPFTLPPEKPHAAGDLIFHFDQMDYYYRVPGEFTHRLTGDQYGFETMSFIVTETHPGGGPGLHVHDVEEAHVLLEGTARYLINGETFTVRAPYIAKVPPNVPHTFINAGLTPFNLIAVFGSKHPSTRRVGPNPLLEAPAGREEPAAGFIP